LLVQRQQHSALELGQIEALLLMSMHAMLPGSLLDKALIYLASRWMKLALYATDGAYPIDNHACVNSIRPFYIGRCNWPYSDTVAGANLYSLLQTYAVNGVDGYVYLRALLGALPSAQTADHYQALLPWRL
jgi:transposase